MFVYKKLFFVRARACGLQPRPTLTALAQAVEAASPREECEFVRVSIRDWLVGRITVHYDGQTVARASTVIPGDDTVEDKHRSVYVYRYRQAGVLTIETTARADEDDDHGIKSGGALALRSDSTRPGSLFTFSLRPDTRVRFTVDILTAELHHV